ncbi:MAG: molybdopterin-dependent oxidoreductase [Chloroflexi bacterium]|nr:molybdopterin-dependent oxidoreductase [Chloroflexota bacterium]
MSNDNLLSKTMKETILSRRSFLKWSSAVGGAAVVAGGLGQGLSALEAAAQTSESAGEWVAAACWGNCGGRCLNKAYVVDGVVTRQKTDDTHEDSPDFPQQRGCARGRSQRMRVYGADRLKYPMKRAHWAPGGGDKSLRGKDEWVRISWDEALDIIASEITRINETYGPGAILWGTNALAAAGGYVNTWGSTSSGTWAYTGPRVIGDYASAGVDRLELRKSKIVVMWSTDPIVSSGGSPAYNYLQAKKAGAKFIFIDPYYNHSAQVLADEWIPIRPGTDTTMLLAMGYVLLTEDDPESNPLIDWDFLNRCTIGFDKDHLPEGADPEDNYRDYVLGLDASGNLAPEGHKNYPPKTPQWASEICGVPPEKIRTFTLELAMAKPVAFMESDASARINSAQSIGQAFVAIGAMIGSIGVSGGGIGRTRHSTAGNVGTNLISFGRNGAVLESAENPVKNRLNNNEIWDAVLTGKYTGGVGPKTDINIQMVYHTKGSRLQTTVGQAKGIQAMRQVEFALCQDFFLTTGARYSDLVLPVTTQWERDGYIVIPNRETAFWAGRVVEPLFEAKDDEWIDWEIGQRLGVYDPNVTELPLKQRIFNQIAGATVLMEDGVTKEPLVSITEEDLAVLGVEGTPQEGRVPILEFKAKGTYQVPRREGDNFTYIALKSFREDPVANPVETETGLIELHSQKLADDVTALGWTTIRPIPAYIPPERGYETTFSDWANKVKGQYPLQMYNKHYWRRSHSEFDNVLQLREAFPQEFVMNPIDAAARGIVSGDLVKITSSEGSAIRPVIVTERIMPGVTFLPHGAWTEFDEALGVDKAGSDNYLEAGVPTVEGHSGFNSQNVEVEKWTGSDLAPDALWPQRIVL